MNMTNRRKMKKAMLLVGVFVVFAAFATDLMAQQPTIGNVYGGGRKANVNGKATIVVNGSSDTTDAGEGGIGNVYGGNDIAGRVQDNSNQGVVINLYGGTIKGKVFGGGNGDYGCENFSDGYYATSDETDPLADTYVEGLVAPWMKETTVNVSQADGKSLYIGALYAGGNKASIQLSGNAGSATLNLTKGTVGYIYGGGRMAPIFGNGVINFVEGNSMVVKHNVYAGNDIANATVAANSQEGQVNVYGNAQIDGAVFGGGNGDYDYTSHDGEVWTLGANSKKVATLCEGMDKPVVKSGEVNVFGGTIAQVYGGGNAADVRTATAVNISGGTVTEVYGGCNQSNVGTTSTVTMTGGNVTTIYGGNNISGTINGAITVDLQNGTVTDKVFGGSNGAYACNDGSVYQSPAFDSNKDYTGKSIPAQGESSSITVKLNGADLSGVSIYAGGNLAPAKNATVELIAGNAGTVYGGGRMAPVTNGEGVLNIDFKDTYAGTIGDVFGGNDIANSVTTTTPSVLVKGNPNITGAVYGGGNGAYEYTGGKVYELGHAQDAEPIATLCGSKPSVSSSTVTIQTTPADNHTIAEVYGGCKAADVTNTATVTLTSGSVGTIYGGCNISGDVATTAVSVSGGQVTGSVFGGSNGAYACSDEDGKYEDGRYAGMAIPTVTTASVTVTNSNGKIANVYAGGNLAPTTTGSVSLVNGTIGNVYGGGRMASVGTGSVNFPDNSVATIDYVYAGNDIANDKDAAAVAEGSVLVKGNPTITGAVFGGGNGDYDYSKTESTGKVYKSGTTSYIEANEVADIWCNNLDKPNMKSGSVTISANLVGVQTEFNTIAAVYGGGNAADISTSTLVTLNSGKVTEVYGSCNKSNNDGTSTVTMPSTSTAIVGTIYGGNNISGNIARDIAVNLDGGQVTGAVFGGSNGNYGCNETVDGVVKYKSEQDNLYPGLTLPTNGGDIVVNMNGATLSGNVYGGGNMAPASSDGHSITLNVKAGNANNIFGGGRMAPVMGTSTIEFDDDYSGTIVNVFGGNDIANTEAGVNGSNTIINVKGDPNITGAVYGGGNGEYDYINHSGQVYTLGASPTFVANLCGFVKPGVNSATVNINMKEGYTHTIKEVYGGCNAADVNTTTLVNLNRGTVGDLYGGCNISGTISGKTVDDKLVGTTVNVNGGKVTGSVFGGSNGAYACSTAGKYTGTESIYSGMDIPTVAAAQVNVNSSSSELIANVYAGGNLAPVSGTGNVTLVDGNIGNVYGGGRMATVGNGSVTFPTNSIATINNVYAGNDIANDKDAAEDAVGSVTVQGNPTINGAVFGGGNGDYDYSKTESTGKVYKSGTTSYIKANEVADIWCNNLDKPNMMSGSVTIQTAPVNGEDLNTIAAVYGGGNAADISTSTQVTLKSGKVTEVYGSCNKSNNAGTSTVTMPSSSTATVGTIYGGNNISGNITGAIAVNLQGGTVTDNVFGGSNGNYGCNETVSGVVKYKSELDNPYPGLSLPTNGSTITVNMEGSTLNGKVYGGGNMAPVSNNITLNVISGNADEIFGGGRMAPVNGSSSIVFDDDYSGTIRNVFAGNDIANTQAATEIATGVVTVKGNPTITGAVFGGGNGAYDYANDMSTVTVDGQSIPLCGLVKPAIYDGIVNVQAKDESSIAFVYGGGNAADVTHDSKVNITSGNVTVAYGGCNAANVGHNAEVLLEQSAAQDAIVGTIYGGNNVSGTIANTTLVTLTNGTVTGDVFGGSNGNYGCNDGTDYTNPDYDLVTDYDGKTIPQTANTQVIVQGATVGRNVYGGGNKAPVTTSASVELISGTVEGSAFAGGRMAPVNGTSIVNFPETPVASSITIGSVFAGNDIANTTAAASTADGVVTVKGHPHITNVFAGGNGDYNYDFDNHTVVAYGETLSICDLQKPNVNSGTVNVQMDSDPNGLIVNVYGGANAADVTTNTTVNMTTGKVTNLFGGNNITGNINGTATVNLVGGDVTNVFGGSNGDYGCNDGARYTGGEHVGEQLPTVANTIVNVNVAGTMGSESNPISIYGGGNMAPVGSAGSGSTSVVLNTGNIIGSAFAGGRMADVNGFATITTPSTSTIHITNVFGGNDISGTINARDARGYNSIGDATPSQVALTAANAASYVKIEGTPTIENVYGGGNGDYDYDGTAVYKKGSDHTDANKLSGQCATSYTKPELNAAFVDINLSAGGSVVNSFGGGNAADVRSAITHINGNDNGTHGSIAQAYAGGNAATVTYSAEILLNAKPNTSDDEDHNVTTIFGGNNLANMNIIPNVRLVEGRVETVYGGGNKGNMLADEVVNGIEHKSTHIEITSPDIEVTGAVYGGCNAADVAKGTYVNVSSGKVNKLFGGNDVSGDAKHAYVMIHDTIINDVTVRPEIGTIFGGSNGMYEYHEVTIDGNTTTYVYPFGTTSFEPNGYLAIGSRAYCDSAEVRVYGGIINGNIYGGGLAGNGSDTYLEIGDNTDKAPLVQGTIFGAGCGNFNAINDCGVSHLGNISGLSITDVRRLDPTSNSNEIYGGGHAGDVHNTQLTIYSSVQKKFNTIYGGGYAGDITGKATTNVEGSNVSGNTADVVYGGNNYGGWVNNTELNIYNGTYDWIYGAGNGEYKYRDIYRQEVCASDNDTIGYKVWEHPCVVPYSNNIVLNLYNPTVNNNVYGGGNLGVVGKDYTSEVNNASDGSNFVTNTPVPVPYRGQNLSTEYGSIVTNIYGGTYLSHVFAGARGRDMSDPDYGVIDFYGRHQLAFAYKQVNMYDGYVRQSLYGGSEFIDDGYPFECVSTNTTTKRPTTVVNLMGGTINKNLYGGGYLGNIHGSVFVNIGEKAVDTSYVWNKTYGNGGLTSYAPFKPELHSANLYVNASVYNGSDWGEAGANSVFNTPGFYGGESQIFLDGEGYETSSSSVSSGKPFMNIKYSLMGAGTSTEGGDCRRQIIVRNYGSYECPISSKAFFSIQRANRVIIENSFFALNGEQDAYTAYPSPDYTFNRIDTLVFRRQNVVTIANPSVYIGRVRSEKKLADITIDGNADGYFWSANKTDYRLGDLVTDDEIRTGLADCNETGWTNCGGLDAANRIVLNDGTYVSVLGYTPNPQGDDGVNVNTAYGPVEGYLYMVSGDKSKSYVYARMKTTSTNPNDGGFIGLCSSHNQSFTGTYTSTGITSESVEETEGNEQIKYENAHLSPDVNYRVWSIGDQTGKRKRQITIVANAAVATADNGQYHVPGCFNNKISKTSTHSSDDVAEQFAVAYGTLQLPPSAPGNYYDIYSMKVDADNEQVKLVETAFNEYLGDKYAMEPSDWLKMYDRDGGTDAVAERKLIANDPSYTFGLMFKVGQNFTTPTQEHPVQGKSQTVLVGADNFSSLDGFRTVPVEIDAAGGVIPDIQFALTYSYLFGNTIIRDVVFDLREFDQYGQEVGPIEVTVTIATVISDFVDVEVPLLAMYNEGRRDTYSRKVIIPASFERRNLTLRSVGWQYDNRYKTSEGTTLVDESGSSEFFLQNSTSTINDASHFGISVKVSENVSDNSANTLGWYDINTRNFDVFAVSGQTTTSNSYNVYSKHVEGETTTWNDYHLYDAHNGRGSYVAPDQRYELATPIKIGSLDGRATAALDVTLHFNGKKLFSDDDTLAYVYLNMTYIGKNNVEHPYRIRIRVWSREMGDTLYVASRPGKYNSDNSYTYGEFVRNNVTYKEARHETGSTLKYGRQPNSYLKSLSEAMKEYKAGDVICALDTIKIDKDLNFTLNGTDFSEIQIIRYSGSHPDGPGLDNAYYGPMIKVTDGAKFKALNCIFNGSGFTRTWGTETNVSWEGHTSASGNEDHPHGESDLTGKTVTGRWSAILFAKAPIFAVEKGGRLDLNRNIEVWNNFNDYAFSFSQSVGSHSHSQAVSNNGGGTHTEIVSDPGVYPGGAIGLYKTVNNMTPTLTLGDNVVIHSNCVYSPEGVDQRGAGIYNDMGQINLGNTNRYDSIDITHNYSITNKETAFERKGRVETLWSHENNGAQSNSKFCFITLPNYGFFNILESTENTHDRDYCITTKRDDKSIEYIPMLADSKLSNVFLTRTKNIVSGDTEGEWHDTKSSLVSFDEQLNSKTRIGITKWFPGLTVRDTIMIARGPVSYPPTADSAFVNENFFDDSTSAYIFYHNDISPNLIYFQRCATFKQRTTQDLRDVDGYPTNRGDELVIADDPTKFFPNKDAKCSAVLDSLQYRLQGGFYPYTFTWQCAPAGNYTEANGKWYNANPIDWGNATVIREGKSAYKNSLIADGAANAQKRLDASVDTCVTVQLAMRPTYAQLDYVYRVTGNDLTGNCPMPQEVDIRVVRTESEPFNESSQPGGAQTKAWLDVATLNIPNPGVEGNLTANIGVDKVGSASGAKDSTRIRYVRVCKGVHLGVDVAPSFDDGYVTFTAQYMDGAFNLSVQQPDNYTVDGNEKSAEIKKEFFCPGDVLNISTLKTKKDDGSNKTTSAFMMWDFDPQAPAENVVFTMPDHDYDIKAIYRPQQHWYEVVTSRTGSFDVGLSSNETPGYTEDYDGNVTITNRAGLAWLISTVNGLNYQQALQFHNKKVTIAPPANYNMDMSRYLWTPLGTINGPFSGEFDGKDVPISGIICLEESIPYVGFFGNVGSENPDNVVNPGFAHVHDVNLVGPTMKGNNYVAGLTAMVNDGSKLASNTISRGSVISGSYIVGGLVAQVNGAVVVDGNTVSTDLLGNAVLAGALVGDDKENANNFTNTTFCDNALEYRNNEYSYSVFDAEGNLVSTSDDNNEESEEDVISYNGPMSIKVTQSGQTGSVTTIALAEGQTATIAQVTFPTANNGNESGFSITVCTTVTTGSQYTNNTIHANTVKMMGSGTEGTIAAISVSQPNSSRFSRRKTLAPQIFMANNYVRFRTSGDAMVAGGLIGQASNSNLINNYVYGEIESQNNAGALLGYVGNNVSVERCYYLDGTSRSGAYGGGKHPKSFSDITSFTGTGNQVTTNQDVDGISNLTRILNSWALAQRVVDSNRYESWRSDLENENHGFPIFGRPDMIKVYDSIIYSECDSFMYNGYTYNNSVVFALNVVDSSRFVDSTIFFVYKVHNSEYREVSDTIELGSDYEGHGFSLTSEELRNQLGGVLYVQNHEIATIQFVDSLLTANGCDSVVVLNLTIYPKVGIDEVDPIDPSEVVFDINVYPNPTRSRVTVETDQIESVEVYDAISRRVLKLDNLNGNSCQVDLTPYSSGVYYFRVKTVHGVAVKKVIKK